MKHTATDAGGCWICPTLLQTARVQVRLGHWLRAMLVSLIVLAYSYTALTPAAYASTQPTGGGTGSPIDLGSSVQQLIPTVEHNGMTLPDFSKINLNSMPAMAAAGKIEVPPNLTAQIGFDLNASWEAGDRITSVIKAGHLSDLGVGSMSLNEIDSALEQAQNLGNIGSITQLGNLNNAGDLSLSVFAPAGAQSIASMSEALPDLKLMTLGSVRPFGDLATQTLGQSFTLGSGADGLAGAIGLNMPIGDFIIQFPDVANLGMAETLGDLSGYSLSEIPGLDGVPIGELQDWQSSAVDGIPGLSDLPLDEMKGFENQIDSSTWAFVARADVPLTTVEQDRKETVSGSFQAGFQVPCEGEGCAHLELTPIAGSQMDVMNMGAFANGKAWIAGTSQLVPGGSGALKAVSGGLEPTGRNPYGSAFKQVMIHIDEPTGTATSAMFFRYCHPTLGCTPYILGPVPFMIYPEKMLVFLGLASPVDDLKGINLPGSPLRSGDGFKSCGGGLSGDAVDKATAAVDQVAGALGSQDGAFSTDSATAAPHISRLLAAFKEEGITCPAQIAYALATIHAETSWVHFGEGATASASNSQGYHGRGYIQHTHIEQYQNIDRAFGTNTVSNPDLLMTDMDLAARAAARSFKEGWTGNGKTLEEAIPCNGQVDYVNARWMINDSDKSQVIAQAATMYYDALSGSEGLDKATATGGCAVGSVPLSGSIQDRIAQAAKNAINDPAMNLCNDAETNYGRVGCMKNVNRVLEKAGVNPLSACSGSATSGYGLSIVELSECPANQGTRVQEISMSEAQPGDIVVVDVVTNGHVGICLTPGCTETISNSSSACARGANSWSFQDGPDFYGTYGAASPRVWRVLN